MVVAQETPAITSKEEESRVVKSLKNRIEELQILVQVQAEGGLQKQAEREIAQKDKRIASLESEIDSLNAALLEGN